MRYFDPHSNAPFLVREHAGHTTKFSIEHTAELNTRNHPLLPSKGALLRWTLEYAGLLGDSAFLRNQVDIQVIIFYINLNLFLRLPLLYFLEPL